MKMILTLLVALFTAMSAFGDAVTLRDGDVCEMRLSGPPDEYTREFTLVLPVDEGSVNIPIVGRVRAAGLSPTQLATIIEKRLKDEKIFTNAQVNINVPKDPNKNVVIVGGSVRNPGRQPWVPGLTLMGALNSAGSVNEWAKDTVKISRKGRSQTFSLKAIKKNAELDPLIESGDNINVEGD